MKENIKIGLLVILTATVVYATFIQDHKHNNTEAVVAANNNDHSGHNHDAGNSSPLQITPENNPSKPALPPTTISFSKSEHDFGKVNQDTKNEYTFEFTNTGNEPLLISDAKGSCGCTVPDYPREPIAPGETGKIGVAYSPGKQKGSQQKTVTLTANTTPTTTQLIIKADVQEVK